MSHRQSIDAIQISLIVVDSSKVSLLFWNENDSKKLSNIRMSLASEITQKKSSRFTALFHFHCYNFSFVERANFSVGGVQAPIRCVYEVISELKMSSEKTTTNQREIREKARSVQSDSTFLQVEFTHWLKI